MRSYSEGDVLLVRAIGGLHVVILAWDFNSESSYVKDNLIGFAIERSEFNNQNELIARYFLRGIKRFKGKDDGVQPGTQLPTSEHPIQSLQWGDYTVKPATKYHYKVIPCTGEPKLMNLEYNSSTTIEITTESEQESLLSNMPKHNVYFNRGAAGSQAYARKFGKTKPNPDDPDSEQMKWLSRGLYEALIRFIGQASGDDAKDYKLRAMLYEFQYLPVGKAFGKARTRGADVDIRYECQSYKTHNEEMIKDAHIEDISKPQKSREKIRHNKFIVLIHKDVPVAVWTGSTNISKGGIFGHSNVGHEIWDKQIAQKYLGYWNALAAPDVTRAKLVKYNLSLEKTPDTTIPTKEILTLFSPRDNQNTLETLNWYAKLMGSANKIVCTTFAFNLDKLFFDVLKQQTPTLKYAVFDDMLKPEVEHELSKAKYTIIASGSKFGKDSLINFMKEELTGFNRNQYIHDKFMLVDPLGDYPIIVSGSANFSASSQFGNDENMLVIKDNKRVADIYFGEFMRIFDHLYARYIVNKLKNQPNNDAEAGYLKSDTKDWLPQHYLKDSRKSLRRVYFMEH